MNIEGRGTILIKCKTSGHKALTNVYYISCLTVNIVSLRQLEEAGYKIVLHGGFLKLWTMAAWSRNLHIQQFILVSWFLDDSEK
jgi:hypothetical protein